MTKTTTHPLYHSAAWRRVRAYVLDRDGFTCMVRLPGCTVIADTVDHVVEVDKGGAWYDESNLRASCRHCNLARSRRKKSDGWRSSRTRVVLVVAPPVPAPFEAYLAAHARSGDVVLDYLELRAAQHDDHRSAMAMRNTLLAAVRAGLVDAARCWITSTAPDAEATYPHHETRVVDPGREEALQLTADDPELSRLVSEWYAGRG
ncbi:MAG: HNH endonuclease [Acidimicrobiales bacterium]